MYSALRLRTIERVARWARQRQGPDGLPLVLQARRLYILPTRAGLGAAVLLFVMLLAGLNYTNSLALLLTFWLAGLVLVGMHECHRTLQGLELVQIQAADCHAGLEGTLELRFANATPGARRALTVRAAQERVTQFDIAANAQLTVLVAHRSPRRGRHPIGRLELASTAPFGLFRCWTWLHLPAEVIVYPRPLGTRPLPPAWAGRAALPSPSHATGEDEWTSLRAYQTGDSPRSIAWKAYARGAPLMVGQYAGAAGNDHLLSFAGLESLDLEARLSQLSAWVNECERVGAASALSIPGVELPLGRGAGHRTAMLRTLALYGAVAP